MKNLRHLIITELFLVKADWNRTFMGEIIREKLDNGKEFLRGSVVVNDGKIWCCAETEEELGRCLDDICTLKLDHNIHDKPGKIEILAATGFFLN